ncbi:MAG: IS3 family transposase [Verrucomicrobiota bacterium]
MSPGHKRQLAVDFVDQGRCTARVACRHFGLHRSTFSYKAKKTSLWLSDLKDRLTKLSRLFPELGYAKIARLLKNEGWAVGARLIQRLRRELGLMVPPKRKRQRRKGPSTGLPTAAQHRGHVWTWDFVHDSTVRGGKLRMLNIIDEYTRECLCIHVDRKINARKVRGVLQRLIKDHGAPGYIRSDNGSEFIEKELRAWIAGAGIKTIYIDPGSPWQNGYIESFNARLRDECLDRELLFTLTEARVVLEDWRWKYNHVRPHRSLGYMTPLSFAEQESTPSSPCWVSGQAPPFLQPSIDFLNHLYQPINHSSRLTNIVAQFG